MSYALKKYLLHFDILRLWWLIISTFTIIFKLTDGNISIKNQDDDLCLILGLCHMVA